MGTILAYSFPAVPGIDPWPCVNRGETALVRPAWFPWLFERAFHVPRSDKVKQFPKGAFSTATVHFHQPRP